MHVFLFNHQINNSPIGHLEQYFLSAQTQTVNLSLCIFYLNLYFYVLSVSMLAVATCPLVFK